MAGRSSRGEAQDIVPPHHFAVTMSSTHHPDVVLRIARAARLIENEYTRTIKLAELASTAGMSAFHFARVFRAVVGAPPHQYLISVRLKEAQRRLESGDSVTTACYAVGFSSPSHFTTAFRREFGVVPSAFGRRRASA